VRISIEEKAQRGLLPCEAHFLVFTMKIFFNLQTMDAICNMPELKYFFHKLYCIFGSDTVLEANQFGE
jgi:hypothetical protein